MTSTNSDTELLTEHFGYPPVSLIDDIINSINILAERALNSVEQGLLNAPPASIGFKPPKPSRGNTEQQPQLDPAEAAKAEIENGTHQLETLLCASIDRNFDKFEIYVLRNILCVRPPDVRDWMRLSHYDGLDFSSIDSPNAPSLDGINHLRRKLRESMRLNALLAAERARNEKALAELRSLIGGSDPQIKTEKTSTTNSSSSPNPAQNQNTKSPFAFLHDKGTLTEGGSEAPLSTTTAFTLSQLQALRALSTSLRNLTPDLVPPPQVDDSAMEIDSESAEKNRKSWRRERLEYVEGATRRYLETVEGLELGRDGEVRDGEWQGEGRNLGRDEVGGLENVVVTVLGGAPSGGGDSQGSTSTAATPGTAKKRAGKARAARDDDRMDES
ncbi:Mis12 protein-domain-containing protein [Hypoxylon trugodes]|uniref:Mis12 protein-domain-containing protein n=1 Tax=Hypoxylon trugodes TaxID=326681 RepID=UPI0021A1D35E|nr:Mis12 protein-domain-containing protein [Hypoxylon trugodes]KAI1393840.1 Mis12 protein-domain-containing protein [Hypoxylon trugodes]